MKDAYSSTCQWSTSSTSPYPDQTVHPYSTKFSACFNEVSSGYDASSSAYASLTTNPAWKYCTTYSDGTTHTGLLANRKWYLPSAGDWWDIMENLCTWTASEMTTIKSQRANSSGMGTIISKTGYYSTFDTKLSAGGAGSPLNHSNYYWCASEYDPNNACIFNFNSTNVNVNNNNKTNNRYVRAVLAFAEKPDNNKTNKNK